MSVQQMTPSDSSITQDLTALNDYVSFPVNAASGGRALVSGTWVGTIKFEGSLDGTNWNPIECSNEATNVVFSTSGISTNASVIFMTLAGLAYIRAIFTSYTSGTATINIRITSAVGNVALKKIGLISGDDYTPIGHVTDQLKVIDQEGNTILNAISAALGGSTTSVFKQNEVAITSRTKFDLSNTTYTVPAGKKFLLTTFAGSYDASAVLYVRLEKQTGGVGAFVTQFRMSMMSGGQGDATLSMNFGNGINIGNPGDVFKLTVEASIAKGTIWAEFSGSEI